MGGLAGRLILEAIEQPGKGLDAAVLWDRAEALQYSLVSEALTAKICTPSKMCSSASGSAMQYDAGPRRAASVA
jgi:hypothetical protein